MIEQLDDIVRHAGAWGLLVVFGGAAIEYLFPPFPGDTVTVMGGLYAVRGELPVPLVFAAIMAGSLAGASVDYFVGRWIGRRLARSPPNARHLWFWTTDELTAWEVRFRVRGAWWLVANRFLPAVRAPIFVAAGVSQMPYSTVLIWGGVSALLHNALLFGAGYAVGGKAERLQEILAQHERVAWAALAVVAVVVLWHWVRRRRSKPPPGTSAPA